MAGYLYGDTGYYTDTSYAYNPPSTGYNPAISNILGGVNSFLQFWQIANQLGQIQPYQLQPFTGVWDIGVKYEGKQGYRRADFMEQSAQQWHDINIARLNNWYTNQMFQHEQQVLKGTQLLGSAQAAVGTSGIKGSPQASYEFLTQQVQSQQEESERNIQTTYDINTSSINTQLEQATQEANIVRQNTRENVSRDTARKYENQMKDWVSYKQGDGTWPWQDNAFKRWNQHSEDFIQSVTKDANLTHDDKVRLVQEWLYKGYELSLQFQDQQFFGLSGLFRKAGQALTGKKDLTMDDFKKIAENIVSKYEPASGNASPGGGFGAHRR